MFGKLRNALAVVALVAGLACVLYPLASNLLYQYEQSQLVSKQFGLTENMDEGDLVQVRKAALAYNKRLLSGKTKITDPFDPSFQGVTNEEYDAALNLDGSGVMATISIPKTGTNCVIYHGTSDEVLQKGVGHLRSTSLPVGGKSSHCVLAGHTGLPTVKVFDALDKLEVGDYFVITVLGEEHAYKVYATEVVEPDNTKSLVIQKGRDLMTLVTCTPYGVNSHRLLVHAERTAMPEGGMDEHPAVLSAFESMNAAEQLGLAAALVAIVLLFACSLLVSRFLRVRRKHESEEAGRR